MQRFYPRWSVALIAIVAIVTIAPAAPKNQQLSNGMYNDYDRPVFLLINLEDDFRFVEFDRVTGKVLNEAEDTGSRVLVLQIGVYRAGFDIFDTRYEGMAPGEVDLDAIPLIDPNTGLPYPDGVESLDHNDATVLGAFKTMGDGVPHMVTPVPDAIPEAVQEAFFNSSPFFDELVANSQNGIYPTTHELACFVYERQGDAGAEFNDIHHAMFASNMKVGCTTCRAEGALFPHQPNSSKIFDFEFELPIDNGNPNRGKLTVDIILPIQVDIKGGTSEAPFNLGSNGLMPVNIPTTEFFDAVAEADVDTLAIVINGNSVYIVKSAYQDVDDDGDIDLVVHFDTQQLVDAGVDEFTTSLTLTGKTIQTGMTMRGSDAIKIVPPTK
ncbi:MAG: hypothetical protein JSU66_07230 [Deltaproteobacteria bacterium]|nr:MAG: hypothetical protein JSU66_07230 [Deltaproteobacteria bacterium]